MKKKRFFDEEAFLRTATIGTGASAAADSTVTASTNAGVVNSTGSITTASGAAAGVAAGGGATSTLTESTSGYAEKAS